MNLKMAESVMPKKKKEYKTKMPIGEILPCPKGHSETYIVMEEAVLKERDIVLGCEVCEEWFTLTPESEEELPGTGILEMGEELTEDEEKDKLLKKLTLLAKRHAKSKRDVIKFPQLKHILADSEEQLHKAIKAGIKDGAITHAGIKDALDKGLKNFPDHADEVMGELPDDVKEGIERAR
jgi:hypothetical protein